MKARLWNAVALVAVLIAVGVTPACVHPAPPTPVAAVADTVTRLEQSMDAVVKAAQVGNTTSNPSTGAPLVSDAALVQVAIVGDKVGRLGTDIGTALTAYTQAKAAGKDLTAQRAAVQALLASVTQALADVGKAIPSGTLATVDAALTSVFAILTQMQASVGL